MFRKINELARKSWQEFTFGDTLFYIGLIAAAVVLGIGAAAMFFLSILLNAWYLIGLAACLAGCVVCSAGSIYIES